MVVGVNDEIFVLETSVESCLLAPCRASLFVERFRADGSIDASFGSEGVSAPIPLVSQGSRSSLALTPAGNPVVATNDNGEVQLAQLKSDGNLDSSFGKGGMVATGLGNGRPELAVQPDGAIVVATESRVATGTSVVLSRYLSDGQPDPGFPRSSTPDVAMGGMALFGDGQILLGGAGCCVARAESLYLGRFSGNGVPDPGFSPLGLPRLEVGPHVVVDSVTASADGKVEIVGSDRGGAFAARVLPSGRVDRRFGNAGIVWMKRVHDTPPRAIVDGKGQTIVSGSNFIEGEPFAVQALVLRRRANGRPDRTFGGGQPVRARLQSIPLAIGLQSGGRIVIFGEGPTCFRECFDRGRTLSRYLGGASRVRCMGRKATIVGTRMGETLTGTPHRDVIAALAGKDTVYGRGGKDLICGGAGHDRLVDGPRHDRLRQ
jgi:uncharacterized delta-60 repeat protein